MTHRLGEVEQGSARVSEHHDDIRLLASAPQLAPDLQIVLERVQALGLKSVVDPVQPRLKRRLLARLERLRRPGRVPPEITSNLSEKINQAPECLVYALDALRHAHGLGLVQPDLRA